ncbi:MAG: trigger factor [Pseudohongiellaceae bacterium]
MQVSIETTKGLERKMTIAVPSNDVDNAVNARLMEAARNVRLDGFRKGKVPMKVVKTRFGKGVRQEVVGELMSKSYYDALQQESIKPAGQPRIEATSVKEGEDLTFTAVFEVYPEVELPDFSRVKAERLVADVDEENIDKMIETLRQQRQTWEDVDREAQLKDRVNIDYTGHLDGEVFPGGTGKGSSLVLGSERMIPGFEDGLVGKKAGETVTLPLTFPKEYHNADMAGKKVEFEITVNSISEQKMPEVDEAFFSSFGIEEGGLEAFRKEVAANMEREMRTASRNKLKSQVMDEIVSLTKLDVPESLLVGEISQLRNQALQQMGGGKNVSPEALPDALFRDQAGKRVVLGLVLSEVVKQKKLTADPAKVREAIEEVASTYESPEEVINYYYGNQEQLAAVESSVMEDQVFDAILEQAVISEKKVSYEKVIQPEQPPAGSGKRQKKAGKDL